MIPASKTFQIECRYLIAALFCFSSLLLGHPLQAGQAFSIGAESAPTIVFPADIGKIVYRKNAGSSHQLYIVASSHRSPITGANNDQTVQAQIETFRIGEWLIRQRQVDLILPEGFFGKWKGSGAARERMTLFDGKILEEKLADTTVFTNAEMLLHQNYGVRLRQVEDREMYGSVKNFLCESLERGTVLSPSFGTELEYLQKRRSAIILQRIPAIIEAEQKEGNLEVAGAMLTIGLAHLDEIIQFLEDGEIRIPAPQNSGSDSRGFSSELELAKKEVGVTVIVPRVLIEQFETYADGKA